MKYKINKYSKKDLKKLLIFPDANANKYLRGKCNCIAGSDKYPGAAILSSLSALKSGSGYVELFTHKNNVKIAQFKNPSIPATSFENVPFINSAPEKPISYVVGPGFSDASKENINLINKLLTNTNSTIIIDGGAIACIANKKIFNTLKNRSKNGFDTIITPHMGEAKILLNFLQEQSSVSNECMATILSDNLNSIVVLKGPKTYISNGSDMYILENSTPALAKAGTGDVLAGIVGGLCCQNKISSFDACILAVNIHALAGHIAEKKRGIISVIAEDVVFAIPKAISKLSTY